MATSGSDAGETQGRKENVQCALFFNYGRTWSLNSRLIGLCHPLCLSGKDINIAYHCSYPLTTFQEFKKGVETMKGLAQRRVASGQMAWVGNPGVC